MPMYLARKCPGDRDRARRNELDTYRQDESILKQCQKKGKKETFAWCGTEKATIKSSHYRGSGKEEKEKGKSIFNYRAGMHTKTPDVTGYNSYNPFLLKGLTN